MPSDNRHERVQIAKRKWTEISQRLDQVLELLNCDPDSLIQWQKNQENLCQCPVNPRHRVPKVAYPKHAESCLAKSRGIYYAKKEKVSALRKTEIGNFQHIKQRQSIKNKALPSSLPFYKQAPAVVSFVDKPDSVDNDHQNIIHVQTSQYPESTEARDEAYRKEVQIAQTLRRQHQVRIADFNVDSFQDTLDNTRDASGSQSKSVTQLAMENRDYRRRRKVYRVKMSQRKPIDIQRQIIEGYMQEFVYQSNA
ncbi:hypothetical protein EC973_009430 [Apophysomyces ossiformis]|uniref:Uncharacterized protein n=1 Tax=Apophysomyces ossiformis TaxID=679940 RepID=A0A8H7BP73_9FUNG|nr:hypothetical protein EC973_009430 [Apophysomyces ossiformis]